GKMAALARLGSRALRLPVYRPSVCIRVAGVSTSKKNKDAVTLDETVVEKAKLEDVIPAVSKNWVSWGFSYASEEEDNTMMHMTFFASVTLCLVVTGFVWTYLPDYKMGDWAQREAFLELRRREAEGLPLIDPNIVPVDAFELPEDDELGETEIII
ncbi:unnamed protein product, partial [Meganyctiphanes norvegica]